MRITGSTLPLLAACQYWARPEVEAPARAPNNAMLLGTEVHSAIEKLLLGEKTAELSDEATVMVSGWADWWQTEGQALLGHGGWMPEVAYAYAPQDDAGRCLGRVGGRNYPATQEGEIVGTVDAVRLPMDKSHAVVVDWKTGDDRGGMIADAANNRQLRGYALAVARAHGVESVRIAVVRIGSDGFVKVTTHDLDAFDLAEAASELVDQLSRIPTAHPSPGSHCARCRAVAVCPATVAAADEIAPRTDELAPAPPPVPLVVDSGNAAALLARLAAVRAASDAVEDALKAFADANGGIVLASGKKWGKVEVERSSIKLDGPEAADALAAIDAAGLSSAIDRSPSTSRAALERVLTAAGLKGKDKTSRINAVMDELRRVGAVRTAVSASYREK